MPPKKKAAADGASKKTVQKKKQQIIEDKTFGMKNKNKSKKVQQQIKSIEKNVMNSGDPKMRKLEEQRAKAKAERKAKLKEAKAEQEALFGEALLAVSKKKSLNSKEGKIEAQGRDGNDDGTKKSTSRAMKMMYQMDAQEMEEKLREDVSDDVPMLDRTMFASRTVFTKGMPNYVPTIEDEIEMERQKKVAELKKAGKGTPVTPESFATWQEKKKQLRKEQARKKVEMELKKKKGGKGLAVLSGRDLYEYKADLFRDRDDDDHDSGSDDEGKPAVVAAPPKANGREENKENGNDVEEVAAQVQSDLFLEGDDDELDDLEDD
eukprot:scaffold7213_cov166-Amphora_coffeaeformis.AAC.16